MSRKIFENMKESNTFSCWPCGTEREVKEANYYCEDCGEYYCLSCRQHHTRYKMSVHHKITELRDSAGRAEEHVYEEPTNPPEASADRNEEKIYEYPASQLEASADENEEHPYEELKEISFEVVIMENPTSKRFNLQGKYILKIGNDDLKLTELTGKCLFTWPLWSIRRYGSLKLKRNVMFESGRKCVTGEGQWEFQSPECRRIHTLMLQKSEAWGRRNFSQK